MAMRMPISWVRRLTEKAIRQLPQQARAAGAERNAQNDLTRAGAAASEQQAGDIGAGDEEDNAHEGHEHGGERGVRRRTPHASLEFRADGYSAVPVGFGILLLKAGPDAGELGLRGFAGHAGLEARSCSVGTVCAIFQRVLFRGCQPLGHGRGDVHRRTEVLIHAGKGLWRDADDGEIDSLDADGPPRGGLVTAQLVLPELVAGYGDGVASRHGTLFSEKPTAEYGLHTGDLEKVFAHDYAHADLW
jgi:hypothetical protein